MEAKIGVYLCEGCEIGKSVDLDNLAELVQDECEVALCKCHGTLCSPEGVARIRDDIDQESLNRISVGACSPRVFPELFEFGDEVLTDRVSLREWVAWTHEPQHEDTQMLAEDYMRMSAARLKNSGPPEAYTEATSKDVVVIGGGVAGMTAALSAADAGYKVTLVEKEAGLGGWATKYAKVFPKTPPYRELEDSGCADLIARVEAHNAITVFTQTQVDKTEGQPGKFEVSLVGENTSTLTVGSVIQATGWKPYDPNKLTHLGYGSSADVITNIEMEDMVAADNLKRPSDGKPIDSIAFVQCAGSRDQDHLPYCSTVCCRVSLKQALYVRQQYPDAKIYILYKDMRTPAQFERFYAQIQEDEGIFLTKGEIDSVEAKDDGKISITVSDTLLGDDIIVECDMTVLATGMVPTTAVDVPPKDDAAEKEEGKEEKNDDAACAEPGAKILNLTYRQGTDLPILKYGFPDSHFICFPYETRRTAIYAAGTVRMPMDLSSVASDAHGAAMKSIQAIEAVARGAAVHPRAGDLTFPDFFFQRCTQCKRCTEECPFGALDEDEKGTPLPNPFRCRRCGVCMGACPERIVSFKNYNVNMISQMIKVIEVPDEFEEKPRILVFACENDALPALDQAALKKLQYNAMVRIIPLRCLGSMNSVWVSDALAGGIDGVILMGCRKGDDYQCHFIKGSELADYRMNNVREKLKQLVLEEERVLFTEVAINDYDKVSQIFDDFLETMEEIGPNPYKDM